MPGRHWNTDRFTARAKKALHLAEEEAMRLQHAALGTHHLLLGLVREGEGVAAQVLARHGVDLERTRTAVARSTTSIAAEGADRAFERTIGQAQQDAHNLGHNYVGTEHLLMALLHEDNGAGRSVLRELGVDNAAIDAEVRVVISLAPGTYVI